MAFIDQLTAQGIIGETTQCTDCGTDTIADDSHLHAAIDLPRAIEAGHGPRTPLTDLLPFIGIRCKDGCEQARQHETMLDMRAGVGQQTALAQAAERHLESMIDHS